MEPWGDRWELHPQRPGPQPGASTDSASATVPREGLEPPCLAAPVTEAGASPKIPPSGHEKRASLPPEKESHLRLPGFNRALFSPELSGDVAVPTGIEPAPPP